MAIRETKENYNAYMRDYYKENYVTKKQKVFNQIDEIIMMIINCGKNKTTKRGLIDKLIQLKKSLETPKMRFTIPDEITDFLNEDILNPLTNAKQPANNI